MNIGIYNRHLATLGGGERYGLAIAQCLSQRHRVSVISHTPVAPSLITQRLHLDLSQVQFTTIPEQPAEQIGAKMAEYDLFINASHGDFIPPLAPKNALLVCFPIPLPDDRLTQLRRQVALRLQAHAQNALYRLVFERWFQAWGQRLQNILPAESLAYVKAYDLVWAISNFTQKWVQRYWSHPSERLYPPVDVQSFHVQSSQGQPMAKKRNQILHVGRFFTGSHNKKHLILIRAFKELVGQGLSGWALHLVGSVNRGEAHEAYLQKVRDEAQGYPIFIHTDIPFQQLVEQYHHSALYWHGSGFGENETRDPARFEHFGITTVEAMAAGCVPVVINQGGQVELISPNKDGFLWDTVKELKAYTQHLIDHPEQRQRMAEAAIEKSQQFSHVNFQTNLVRSLQKIGIDSR